MVVLTYLWSVFGTTLFGNDTYRADLFGSGNSWEAVNRRQGFFSVAQVWRCVGSFGNRNQKRGVMSATVPVSSKTHPKIENGFTGMGHFSEHCQEPLAKHPNVLHLRQRFGIYCSILDQIGRENGLQRACEALPRRFRSNAALFLRIVF